MKNKWKSLSRIFGVVGNIVFILMLLSMSALVLFLVQSKIAGKPPGVAGYQMLIVISGSMSPAIDTGSVVFVRPLDPENLTVGDIITFKGSGGSNNLTTHRVAAVHTEDGLGFTTRGDANNVNDPNKLPAQNVVGKVFLAIPYAGYLFNYVQTKQGLILLILIPGTLIISTEMFKLFNYARQIDKQKEKSGKKEQGLVTGKQQDELETAPPVRQASHRLEAVDRNEEVIVKEKIAAAVNEPTTAAEPALRNRASIIDEAEAKTVKRMIIEESAYEKYTFEKPLFIENIKVPDMIAPKKEKVAAGAAHLYDYSVKQEPVRKNHYGERKADAVPREKVWKERASAILNGQPVAKDRNIEEKVWKEHAFALLSGLSVVIDDTEKEEVS